MEEIDNIIIETLKHLNCNIDEDVTSIKNFDPDMVVDAVVRCLEVIKPGVNMPHKLSPSMSLRLKLATSLTEHIKELGFRGDIGYQTILYCNEVEVRRVLMFLLERLPRETDTDIPIQQTGYVYNLTKRIEEKVKLSLNKKWIPTSFLRHGIRQCRTDYLKSSYISTYPLRTENVKVPSTQSESEHLKEYWVYYVNDITKQCSDRNLIPSLIFRDTDFNNINLNETIESIHEKVPYFDINVAESNTITPVNSTLSTIEEKAINPVYNVHEMKINTLSQNIKQQKQLIIALKQNLEMERNNLAKVSDEKLKEEEHLKELLTKCKIKSRTLTVLSKEDNLEKLKNLIQSGNERLTELETQWRKVEAPLLAEYNTLNTEVTAAEVKLQEEKERIRNIKDKKLQLQEEVKNKDKLEKLLKEERERLSKNTRRSAYTRRILEIIGNIKKQNDEIQKILNDTKVIQKDINSLNGQLDRSFTLCDELIFRNAKQDEMSRKAYKLLATLHNDCGAIIQTITEMGVTERESRNLQEQIDTEISKAVGISLEQVNADIQNVRKEIGLLAEQK
ncbi:jm1 protein [Holotrichia oblita]|uniref:Jm1 protein n=1 Tax=Holotrichia oblita TaxID=644536 RepID=A0ACB9TBJ6_HOLOL|nr:jm1 protein [Holotrichia oblita]